MNKSLVKKIVSISIVSLVLALVITTIVLALVPKKMNNPIVDGYANITVYQNGAERLYSYDANATSDAAKEHNEIYKKIQSLHEDSLKDNLLSAIFQGTGSFNMSVVKKSYSNALTTVKNENGNALVFNYLLDNDDKMILEIDGEVYRDESALNAPTVTFDTIVMPLGTSESYEECIIYLANSTNSYKSEYQVKFLAHQAELNDFISGLEIGLGTSN